MVSKLSVFQKDVPKICIVKQTFRSLNFSTEKGEWKCDENTKMCPVRCWQKCAKNEKGSSVEQDGDEDLGQSTSKERDSKIDVNSGSAEDTSNSEDHLTCNFRCGYKKGQLSQCKDIVTVTDSNGTKKMHKCTCTK